MSTDIYTRDELALLGAVLTVQICWDADPFDLGRAGMKRRREKLCTEEAREPVPCDLAYR